jgi:hypothetical protein
MPSFWDTLCISPYEHTDRPRTRNARVTDRSTMDKYYHKVNDFMSVIIDKANNTQNGQTQLTWDPGVVGRILRPGTTRYVKRDSFILI